MTMINQSNNRITLSAIQTLEAHLDRVRSVAFTATTDGMANGDFTPSTSPTPNQMITYAVDALTDDAVDDPDSHSLTATMMRDLSTLLERISELDD
jgi:hypothetical protein